MSSSSEQHRFTDTAGLRGNRTSRSTLGLLIPLYNEEAVLSGLIGEIERFRSDRPFIDEVLLVDDGSTDRTADLVRGLTAGLPGYTLIQFSRNFGKELAITAGLNSCEADAIVILDADLQDPLDVVDTMVARWREGYDVVYGIRRKRRGVSWMTRTFSATFYRLFQHMADTKAPADVGDFRLLSRPVIEAYREFEERQPYVRGLISWVGFRQTGVEFDRPARAAGVSKYPYRKRFQLALNSILAFSDRPLRYAAGVGFMVALLSVAGLIWTVLARLYDPDVVSGWASLIFTAFFFGGLQLFFLGVVGAYLARVYDEVKGRPRYIVSRRWTSDDAGAGDNRRHGLLFPQSDLEHLPNVNRDEPTEEK